ncbi:hypothetical protein NQ314_013131 [Rhamnusium bicolor]|uniref:Major facilitator superfamily (MFS) profile domain-containing protein n=1 Tax=Rhamnusium bicolor TaxID=1586634 RepID=A0AAV8X7B6_9CUCU|nr:hypothetical protein NQ314_013131 [Rhamnusium bicolor]
MGEEMMDIDTMLNHVGDFGRFQIILMLLFSVINAFSAFHYFGQTFISIVPDYECDIDIYDQNITIARECHISILVNDTYIDEPCTTGWKFDKNNTYGFISIIEEVCTGSVIGSLALGVLGDVIGRLHVLVTANLLAFAGNIATIFSSNAGLFAASRFIAGCATDSNFFMMYIIVMEYIKPSLRTLGLNLCIGIFYCLSCMAVPWVAVLLGNWRMFLVFISVPHLFILGFYFLVPESAQWLISKGRTEEAIQCFRRIAKINKRNVSDKAVEALKLYCSQHVSCEQTHESF